MKVRMNEGMKMRVKKRVKTKKWKKFGVGHKCGHGQMICLVGPMWAGHHKT